MEIKCGALSRFQGLQGKNAACWRTIQLRRISYHPRMLVYTHPDCLAHDAGPGHPESPHRLRAVLAAIASLNLSTEIAPAANRKQLLRAHDAGLVDQLFAANAPVRIDADTMLGTHSLSAAVHACGAGIAAINAIAAGTLSRAFCAVRPPGHHATRKQAMGFCLFNAIAVAAYAALDLGFTRVSIVDFDVHHGNGTQDIFSAEPRVQYLSTHQAPLYPGTGAASEIGLGNICNAPLPAGAGSSEFRTAIRAHILPALDQFAPALILVSAGFDAHYLDPLAGLNLDAPDYAWVTEQLVVLAKKHAGGRMVSMLEGGYSATALQHSVRAHLQALFEIQTQTKAT
jgi:acetoin utilization deacetylase AcuC-like enzyme